MATEKYVSQANFEHVWGNLSAMLDKKVSTNDSRLSDARVPRAHTHGNIDNVGLITNAAVTVASGDSLLVGDASANNAIVKSSIAFGTATTTYLRNDGTWGTPANTTYNDMKGATASAAGTRGLVPAPAAGAQAKFLRGDGTWAATPNDNTTYDVFTGASSTTDGSSGLVPKPSKGDQAKYLRADGVWASPANTDTKVTNTLATTTKAYITGTTSATTNTGTQIFDTGVYLDTTAGTLVATKFSGALSGNADSSTKATNDSLNNPITGYVKSLSINGRTITITKGDGTTSTITTQDNDHTYNDFTGASSTAGGKNGLVPAPAVGQQDRFLKADGTWAVPTDTNDKVTNTLNTAAKAYITGTTSATTNTGTQVFDTGVYLDTTAGTLVATKFKGALEGNASTASSATKATNDSKDQAITGYIRGLSVSGRVITYTKGDGTTGTITTQDTNSTYNVFTGATADAAGSTGLVPAPAKGDQAKFLRADGTWVVPTNTWRGIQDNLTSTAADQSLSANQGRVLKGLVDGKAASSHTHKYASGFSVSGTTVTVSYGDGTTGTFKTQDTNTTYNDLVGATADKAGTHGLVPAPKAGDQAKFLKADGTWGIPTNTTYGNFGGATSEANGGAGLVPGPSKGQQAYYLAGDGNWKAFSKSTVGLGNVDNTADANKSVKSATSATNDSKNQAITGYIRGLSISGKTITVTKGDGTTSTLTTQDTWRGIQNNLTSTATDQSLSAAQGKILNETKATIATLTNQDLDTVKTPGFYNAGGGNSCTNKPANYDNFGMEVIHNASGDYYTQIAYDSNGVSSRRTCTNGKWGSWVQDQLTDTKDWNSITGKPSTFTPTSHTHNYAGSASAGGSANSAVKLDTATAGSATQPVYFTGGKPVACTYTIQSSVPANAKFTDTTYGVFGKATADAAGSTGLVPAPAKGDQAKFLRADGTWVAPTDTNTWRGIQDNLTSSSTSDSLSANQGRVLKGLVDGKVANTEDGANGLLSKLNTTWTATPTDDTYFVRQDTGGGDAFGRVKFSTLWTYIKGKGDSTYQAKGSYAAANHTHSYAGSASVGGSANSAVKLDTATAGSATQPVYFTGGKPAACTYTLAKSVPADAKFTDTTYGDATQSNHGLMTADDKKKVDGMWNVVTISKSLTLTTNWQDTGITGNNLDSGTYILQVSGMTTNSNGFYQEVYSGIMTWFNGSTNSTTADEIPLHNSGHADNSNEIYLRTIRSAAGTDNSGRLKLQIAAKAAGTKADTIVFKFRRMI